MKKIIFVLFAAVALLCGCTKSASTVAAPDASKVASLTYDTASTFDKNTGNRATIYTIEGKYVKVTVGAFRDDETYKADYFITAATLSTINPKSTADDSDYKKGLFVDCKICKVDGSNFVAVNQVAIDTAIIGNLARAGKFVSDTVAVKGGAYYVCAFDEEKADKAVLSFVVALPSFDVTPYKADVTYDPETPFSKPTVVKEDFETSVIKLYYRQFAEGKWI